MNSEQAKTLREKFPEKEVGKLPRLTCQACSKSPAKHCDRHSKSKCAECGNYISTAHIHLDYVGHAATTDRLLKADPGWTWRFLATNADGTPVVVRDGFADPVAKVGFWIVLTVCGTETPGFGEGKGYKDAIGDAIRNAAMRRGVALDLWSKEELSPADHPSPESASEDKGPEEADATPPVRLEQAASVDSGPITQADRKRLFAAAREAGLGEDDVRAVVEQLTGETSTAKFPKAKLDEALRALAARAAAGQKAAA